jgi:hypothetical protein
MPGRKKKNLGTDQYEPTQFEPAFGPGAQPNNQPRSYQPPSHQGAALPGHAGFQTYKLRKKNAMTDMRFTYVRPDGKPDRGPGRYAK